MKKFSPIYDSKENREFKFPVEIDFKFSKKITEGVIYLI